MDHVFDLLKSHADWPAAEKIYHILSENGYKAFFAGGCVRDALLGKIANDLDIATDASPEKIELLFEKTVNVGKNFGVMRVLFGSSDVEVATFRTDGKYVDGRRPETVIFSSPKEDALRRDFTINALFFDMQKKEVIDFVDGEKDLRMGLIRTVGRPESRFEEDKLRLLRAARFVAQLGFEIEEETKAAMKKMANQVVNVSGERIRDELIKMLRSPFAFRGLKVMEEVGFFDFLFAFRKRNNSWLPVTSMKAGWEFLTLFFREANRVELTEGLALLRLSYQEQGAIERAWVILNDIEVFLNRRDGVILKEFSNEGVVWALCNLKKEGAYQEIQINHLLEIWEAFGRKLPQPFLTGHDVQMYFVGREIGKCLELAYELQIENKIKNRAEALIWLQEYIERDKNE